MNKQTKITKDFKNQIELFLSKNNVSQANFAKECDIQPSTISRILSGNQTKITSEKYNNMSKIINSSICDYDSIKDISVRERGLTLRREYDLSMSDMSRIFDTDVENIRLLLNGEETLPDLHVKVLYYFDNKEEFEELCKEKRFIVSKFDKQKIIDKVNEMHSLGIDAREISDALHTSPKKINNILNNNCAVLGYPSNPKGRQIFNDIINGDYRYWSDPRETNFDSYNEIEQKQYDYHSDLFDEIFNPDSTFDNTEETKMDKIDYISSMLRDNSDHFSPESIDKLIDIISIMYDINDDKIKIHIDIDL